MAPIGYDLHVGVQFHGYLPCLGAFSVINDLRLKLQCVLCANYAQSPWSLLLIYGHQGEYNFTRNLIPAGGFNADLQRGI